ncbi:hypothetical protein ACG04R_01055 [Roseateles sp. BYS78W]|uniref:DUF2939 domain-containing protein n=1 Tax=Pelomonas candidula TaxID=3299025 RepID=A0ABW7H5R5_9BURK
MRIVAFLVTAALLGSLFSASAAELSFSEQATVLQGAHKLQEATLRSDARTVADLTSPLIARLGVPVEAIQSMTQAAMKQFAAMGLLIDRSEFGTPGSVYAANGVEACFIPYRHEIHTATRRGRSIGYLIALRDRPDTEWKFLDSAMFRSRPELLGRLLPGLPSDAKIPDNRNEFDD